MTDTSSLSHLIERLERCAGPDRELDRDILTVVRGLRVIDGYLIEMDGWYYSLDGDEKNPAYPSPTQSIDAAMALVPEGAGLRIDRYWTTTAQSAVWSALISTGGVPNNPRRVFEHYDGPNAAIAVSIAALKAHSVRDPGDSTKERALLLSKSPAEGGEM